MKNYREEMMRRAGVLSLKKQTATNEELEEQLADLSEYVDVLTEMLMGGIDDGD